MLDIAAVPAYTDNYIWMIRTPADAARVVAVDPGDAEPVETWLADAGATLAAILVTHHHWDHVDGVADLVASRRCPVWGPKREDIPCRTHAVGGGDRVEVEGLRFEVLDIPGHTAGHIAYHGHGIALVGDTLFAAGCGRLFEGTPQQMFASLDRLAGLPPETLVYCGHEYTLANLRFARTVEPANPGLEARERAANEAREAGRPSLPVRIADERATNPFLRCREAPVAASASVHAGRDLRNPVEVFATVRHWKDGFS